MYIRATSLGIGKDFPFTTATNFLHSIEYNFNGNVRKNTKKMTRFQTAVTSAVTIFILAFATAEDNNCSPSGKTNDTQTWQRDPYSCSTIFMCVLGKKVIYKCPPGYVTGVGTIFCVEEGSEFDKCKSLFLLSSE